MFECNYKFTIDDAIKCAKYVYKSGRSKKEKIILYAVPVLLVIVSALLVVDIINKRAIVWDVILLVGITLLFVLTLIMPLLVVKAQKKQYNSQNFNDMDSLSIKINNGILEEAMMKNGEAVLKNTHNLKTLVSFLEDDEDIILVYATGEYTCIKKSNLVGDIGKLRATLTKAMTKIKKR